jgi:HrpA-like RNA helicase
LPLLPGYFIVLISGNTGSEKSAVISHFSLLQETRQKKNVGCQLF